MKNILIILTIISCSLANPSPDVRWSAADMHSINWYGDLSTITAIAQSSDGFIWLGTLSGLIRFDGFEIEKFSSDNIPELTNNKISALCEDESGKLLIGTDGGGLTVYKAGKWRSIDMSDGLSDNHVRTILSDWQGRVWVGTDYGLNCLFQDSIRVFTRETGLYDNIITALGIDIQGDLLVGTFRSGLLRFDNGVIQAYGYREGLTNLSVTKLLTSTDGKIWIATLGGLFYLPLNEEEIQPVAGTRGIPVLDLMQDSDGYVWYSTMTSGLARIEENEHISVSPQDDYIHCILQDVDNTIWAGTDTRGLLQYKSRMISSLPVESGHTQPVINALFLDYEGTLWAVCRNLGLIKITNMQTTVRSSQIDGLHSDRLTAILHLPNGELWLGSEDNGLLKITNNFKHKINLPVDNITTLAAGASQSVWIGSTDGIFLFDRSGRISRYLSGRRINAVYRYDDQTMVATDNGAYRFSGDQFELIAQTINIEIFSFWQYTRDLLLAGTGGNGLLVIDTVNQLSLSTQNGLPDNHIFSITMDHNQVIWLTSLKGVFSISSSELDDFISGRKSHIIPVWYDESDGMLSAQCQPASAIYFQKKLYVPTVAGISVINTEDRPPANHPPGIMVKGIRTENGYHNVASGSVNLPTDSELLEIYISVFDYFSPGKQHIQYQLIGFDPVPRFLSAGRKRIITYQDLPAGEYRFIARALNPPGSLSSETVEMSLILPVPFYQSFFFLISFSFVIAGLTIGGLMLRRDRKQKKAANKYKTVSIDRERAENAAADIQRLMNEQKLYLNPDLTLKDLARKLNLHSNYLSRVLNEYFRQSYSDFINEFRISEAMKMLGNPDHRDRTILEIMYETGFYSKSVFNTAFKKLTGKTPSAYRRQKLG